jgi:hypothetical protein
MGWYGPRGTCGCCGGDVCECPSGFEGVGYPPNSLTPNLRVVVSLPSYLTETVIRIDAINNALYEDTATTTGLSGLNGTHFFETTNGTGNCLAYSATSPGTQSVTLSYDITRNLYNLTTCAFIASSTFSESVTLSLIPSVSASTGGFGVQLRTSTANNYFNLVGTNSLLCRTGFIQADETSNLTIRAPRGVSDDTFDGNLGNVYGRWAIEETQCSLSPSVTDDSFIIGTLNSTIVWL